MEVRLEGYNGGEVRGVQWGVLLYFTGTIRNSLITFPYI